MEQAVHYGTFDKAHEPPQRAVIGDQRPSGLRCVHLASEEVEARVRYESSCMGIRVLKPRHATNRSRQVNSYIKNRLPASYEAILWNAFVKLFLYGAPTIGSFASFTRRSHGSCCRGEEQTGHEEAGESKGAAELRQRTAYFHTHRASYSNPPIDIQPSLIAGKYGLGRISSIPLLGGDVDSGFE
ncbi:hypothetical protein BJV78DRAFT_1152816 [Lactifluus subvellereus]|nr:hypothetical protein BJV78DRAFT_1152816 [Lactifluus subvellereus]